MSCNAIIRKHSSLNHRHEGCCTNHEPFPNKEGLCDKTYRCVKDNSIMMAMNKGQSPEKMMRPLHNEPSENDEEIEFIRRRKMLELQKRALEILARKRKEEGRESAEEMVRKNLTEKAREVLDTALAQYPRITRRIIIVLANAIRNGEIKTPIDGVTLYNTFRYLGIPIRLETKIRFYEKGRYIDLKEKLKED